MIDAEYKKTFNKIAKFALGRLVSGYLTEEIQQEVYKLYHTKLLINRGQGCIKMSMSHNGINYKKTF